MSDYVLSYRAVHSHDVVIRLDIPSLAIIDLPIGTAQKIRTEIVTEGEPYWPIGGPINSQLGTIYSSSILATDFFRHRTSIKGSITKAVMSRKGEIAAIGMSLLLSPADYKNKLANSGEPFLPPNDAEIKFDVAYAGRRLVYSGIVGITSVLDSQQGQYAFETIDFWARSMTDKSII